MKKKFIYLLTGILGLTVSCGEEFTELTPLGTLSNDQLANAQGVDLKLTAAYSVLDGQRNDLSGNGFAVSSDNWWFDVISDDAHKGSTDGDQLPLFQVETYDWQTNNEYFLGRWSALFAGVNRSNAVISLIASLEGDDFSAKLAEARFLRGFFNFELQKIWGNVPYISEDNYVNTEFNQPNPGPIWDQIEADFQFAIDNLPAAQDLPGRATSWAAMSMKGKVHLYQGEYGEALTLLQTVIDQGPYSLNAEFVDNFTLAGENSPESIFAIQFAADDAQSFNGNVGGTLNFPGGGPFNSCCGFYVPTQNLVNAFQVDGSGLPLLDTFGDSDVANDYGINSDESFTIESDPLDPRVDYTVGRRGIDYNNFGENPGKDWVRVGFSDISGPYLPKKNIYYAGEGANMGTGGWGQQHSGVNYNIIRFSDVLLMAAEAAVEKTNPDLPLALNYVNRVRNRAKNMTPEQAEDGSGPAANYDVEPYPSFGSVEYARKAVRFERRLELAMEGHRFFDLARWGVASQVLNEYVQDETRTISNFGPKTKSFQAHMKILPIPQDAIDLSQNVLTQNPQY